MSIGGMIHRAADSEGYEQARRIKPFIVIGAIFVWSCWNSLTEFRYLIWGQKTTASIVQDFDAMGRERPIRSKGGLVKVSFTDGGEIRKHSISIPASVDLGAGQIEVEYLANSSTSPRLPGEHNWISLCVVLGSGVAVAWLGRGVLAEAREYSSGQRKRPRR